MPSPMAATDTRLSFSPRMGSASIMLISGVIEARKFALAMLVALRAKTKVIAAIARAVAATRSIHEPRRKRASSRPWPRMRLQASVATRRPMARHTRYCQLSDEGASRTVMPPKLHMVPAASAKAAPAR